jgi:Uma2 family endonuclease
MLARADRPYLSPDQYLRAEAAATTKHEYIDGEVIAMAGASTAHGLLTTNLIAMLRPHVRGSRCQLFASDMKVNIVSRNRFYYPDLLMTCDDRDRTADHYKCFPKLIVEVLSDSTEAFDRGDKFSDYCELSSLDEYLLVSQRRRQIDRFCRNGDHEWRLTRHGSGEILRLHSIDFECAINDVYEDVEITP